ncbi:type II secretory pathway component PulK [Sedimentibacter acidaminivorans]|uniref:Type II secretory pathway component PulK n=1 Tax=Sedimentibacter acidaminivorans TaxID=913099 RepID=A0ABS4GI19_9FIRM|nr:hypothetical protein [Sedimentibacter acidaminivorans]MBP1927335.1 type II secretory pathway component PulK [Sedimentibacter acidaminivorans]
MDKIKFFKKEQGSALVMVIIAFMVITIITTSVFVLAGNNTRQVVSQNDGMESYYIARSGAEATYQALLTSSSLLTQFQSGSTVQTDTITFDEGTAEITVEGFNEGTTRRVRITSVGKAAGKNVSRKSILEFNYNGYGDIKWSR